MADEIDLANEQAERFLKQSLANRSTGPKLQPCGHCQNPNCELPFDAAGKDGEGHEIDEQGIRIDAKLFCDKTCADEYTELLRLRGRR
ncbi:hypothetical protein D3C71_23830 [compost metagenome]